MNEEQTKQLLAEGQELAKNIEYALKRLITANDDYGLKNNKPKEEDKWQHGMSNVDYYNKLDAERKDKAFKDWFNLENKND